MSYRTNRRMLIAVATALLGMVAGTALANGDDGSNNMTSNTIVHPVGNPYAPAYGHPYRHGAVPTRDAYSQMMQYRALHMPTAATTGPNTLSFGGGYNGVGVTSGIPRVYLVVYGNQWGTASTDGNGNMNLSGDAFGAVPYLESMFKGMGTGGELWSGTMTQYCDGPAVSSGATSCPVGAAYISYPTGGSAFAGIWYDNSAAAPPQATQDQLGQEALNAAQHFGNTTADSNRYAQYVILSPTGTHPDGFNTPSGNFCAWHSDAWASSYGGFVAYTNMPYVNDMNCGQGLVNGNSAQGNLDGFSIVEGHEYAETITDQIPDYGWFNSNNASTNGGESGDECAWIYSGQGALANVVMGNGSYAMQSIWSNDTNECDMSHPIVGTPPPPVVATITYINPAAGALTQLGVNGATVVQSQTQAIAAGYTIGATVDLNNDGIADFAFTSPTSRQLYVWLNDGNGGRTAYKVGSPYPAGWTLVGAGKVDASGKNALIWCNESTGQVAWWELTFTPGSSQVAVSYSALLPTAIDYKLTLADLNGDGFMDFVFTGPNNDLYTWINDGTGHFAHHFVGDFPAGWVLQGAGDVDGDGKSDLLFTNDTTHQFGWWLMNGNTVTARGTRPVAPGYWIAKIADFNGDGKADVLWMDAAGDAYDWQSTGSDFQGYRLHNVAGAPVTLPSSAVVQAKPFHGN
ncbi:VCBS repeat-containing protein [Rhodanobacter sp. C06]|uniref:FG-GAP repeat domain-containing protein n=1 Tax=Rhodanobacter sp. C06 TaxID=1945854 RepID=UPI0009873CAF|nr:VCBS repeat-containing protein [Rhodanobacter sp. C06]